MKPLLEFTVTLLLVFPVLAFGGDAALPLPYYNSPDFTPAWAEDMAGAADAHRIAPFRFTDQDGDPVTSEQLRGNIYVANFFFTTCPGICSRMTTNLKTVQEAFAGEQWFAILSHSVTPDFDTPQRLKEYERRRQIDGSQWRLLTGDKGAIYTIARQSYFLEREPGIAKDAEAFIHSENLILVDCDGRIRGVYNGVLANDMDRLIQDIQTLKIELGQ